jgi:hypothetical protein
MAKLPTVTSNIPRDLRTFVDRVREAMDGSGPDALVSARQLVAAGVATYTGNVLGPVNTEAYTTPARPKNVQATGALANIMVTWDKPVYNGHAYAEIWAASQTSEQEAADEAPTIGQAELVGMSPGVFFAHNIGTGGKRWYWVRFVNFAGDVGPYQSTEGIAGETSVEPEYVLEVLTGAITQNQLYSELSTKVDRIDGKTRVFYQDTAPTGTEDFPLVVSDLWVDSNRTYFDDYVEGDYEILSNRLYRWDGSNWVEAMDYGARDFFTSIKTEKNQRIADGVALGQRIDSVEAGVTGVNARVDTEATARAEADSANASLISTLSATVANNKTVTDAWITDEKNIAADATGAVAESLESLRATYLDPVNGSVWATINQTASAAANATGAVAGRVDTIEANYVTDTDINAAIQNADTVSASELGAVATSVTTLRADMADDIAAAVQVEASARAAADGTINSKYTVKLDTAGHVAGYGLISSGNVGNVTSEFGIRADTFFLAPPTNTDANAPTQNLYPGFVWLQNGDAQNYTTKYWTGSAWSTVPQNLPFVVRTSPTTINGEAVPAGVYMRDAFIANGTITNAKIGDAAIDNAKIANLDAGKITTGYLDANRIQAGSITANMIDSRGLSIKDVNGNVILAAGTPLSASNVSGLGSLATANSITTSEISNAGSLASMNSIDMTYVSNAGAFATLDQITADNVSTYIASAAIDFAQIDKASINDLSSIKANMGTITAGKMQSQDGNFVIDLDNKTISIET